MDRHQEVVEGLEEVVDLRVEEEGQGVQEGEGLSLQVEQEGQGEGVQELLWLVLGHQFLAKENINQEWRREEG